ncbi:MAG: FMN-binding negative transcriptional regulator [Ferruginibacter sp.]|nr:FMN-binding negative transcriptional regulator [Ferruginibacter sp.]
MYKLPYFTEEDPDKVIAFMKENSFAVIAGFGTDYPVASHLPLEIETWQDGKVFFSGHLMKNTDHHKAFEKNENVLVIFNGPHTYVSASWYEEKEVASTWNYMTVHAQGKIKFTDDEGTYKAIKAITNKYEETNSAAAFDRLAPEYTTRLMKAIVGFEIEVVSLDNVFKLSQNHTQHTRESIAGHLQKKGDEHSAAIAKEIKNRFSEEV